MGSFLADTNYGDKAEDSSDYTRMVNERHAGRMAKYIQEAAMKGATIHGGKCDDNQNYIEPTIVTDAPMDCDLMLEEIFGPVLPVFGYQSLDEAIAIINSRERPLALYVYSKRQKNIDNIISNTRAGGYMHQSQLDQFFQCPSSVWREQQQWHWKGSWIFWLRGILKRSQCISPAHSGGNRIARPSIHQVEGETD
jgi:Aldehyde dehydrogenase family